MKNCPFCKNQVERNAFQCPACKRTLAERISVSRPQESKASNPPPKAEKASYSYYTPPNSSSSSSKKQFQMPRFGIPTSARGWIISIVGSLVLTAVLNAGSFSHSSPNPLPPPVTTPAVTADAPVGGLLKGKARTLANGTVLFSSPSSFGGAGTLTISNGSGSNAVVKLITSGGRKVYSVYIRSGSNFTIEDINDGVYRLLFMFGSDWDADQQKFLVDARAEAFDDTFDFQTTDTKYRTFEVTLNPVAGGDATTSTLDPSEFEKY